MYTVDCSTIELPRNMFVKGQDYPTKKEAGCKGKFALLRMAYLTGMLFAVGYFSRTTTLNTNEKTHSHSSTTGEEARENSSPEETGPIPSATRRNKGLTVENQHNRGYGDPPPPLRGKSGYGTSEGYVLRENELPCANTERIRTTVLLHAQGAGRSASHQIAGTPSVCRRVV